MQAAVDCSTAGRPCRSSPATARRPPARSTTRSCAPWRSGCATCASWRSGGPRSWSRSRPGQARRRPARRRSWPPTPRPGWRTSTCPSSPSGAPRRRSPARPASSRSPTRCSADPSRDPQAAAAGYVDAEKGVADAAAALDGARAILVERFAEDADLIGELRERMWARGRLVAEGPRRQGGGRRQVLRLLRLRRALHQAALAPGPGDVPRREGGGPRPHPGARARAQAERRAAERLRAAHRPDVRHRRPRPPGRQVAARHRPLGLAHPHPGPPRHRPADAAVPGGRGRGGPGLRRQPARPAARRAGRHPRHHGPGPGLPHRRQGRRGRRHRQGGRHRHDLPARAAPTAGTSRSPRWPGSPRRTRST